MKRIVAALAFLFCVPSFAQFVTVTGSHLTDASGKPVSNAIISFQSVLSNGQPTSFRVGVSGGQSIVTPVSAPVVNGAFALQVADSSLTNPANLCYAVTEVDRNSGDQLLGGGYTCVQPASGASWCSTANGATTCNFDNYVPNLAPQVMVQPGPAGPQGPPGPSTLPAPPAGFNQVTGWGDSLTAGGEDGSGVTWPNALASLIDQPVNNEGVGGQTSAQIGARQGGVQTTVTVSGGSIPASGGVTVTFPAGYEPVTQSYQPPLEGSILGVSGTVTLSGGVYTFTRTTAGSAIAVPNGTPFVPSNGTLNNAFVVIWAGRNDAAGSPAILTNIAAMVANLPSPKRFVVLSVINDENEPKGGATYNAILSTNAALAAAYPRDYLDIRSLLVSQYNPAVPADVADHTNDIPPYSLRAQDVSGTLTAAIGNATCSIAVSGGVAAGNVLTVDSETILVSAVSSPTQITGCTRGYNGTTAASHASGAAFTGVDPIHLNAAGYTYVAQQLETYINAANTAVLPQSAVQSMVQQGVALGTAGKAQYYANGPAGTVTLNADLYSSAYIYVTQNFTLSFSHLKLGETFNLFLCSNGASHTVAFDNTTIDYDVGYGWNATPYYCSGYAMVATNKTGVPKLDSMAASLGGDNNTWTDVQAFAAKIQAPGSTPTWSIDTLGNAAFNSVKVGNASWTSGATAPSGACTNGSLYSNTAGAAGATLYACVAAAWVDIK